MHTQFLHLWDYMAAEVKDLDEKLENDLSLLESIEATLDKAMQTNTLNLVNPQIKDTNALIN